MKKRLFETIFEEICNEKSYKISFLSDGWLMQINKGAKVLNLVGYNFPLNSISTYQICLDKFICSQILSQNKINSVEYFLIHNDEKRKYLEIGGNLENDLEKITTTPGGRGIKFPIVVKPNQGTGGKDVFLCKNFSEANGESEKILKTKDVVVSEFVDSVYEYRFVVLNGKVELAYKKVRTNGWKHNLSRGAVPEILNKKEISRFSKEIKKIVKALDLRLGAIDFLVCEGKPMVLEINSGIAMDHFGALCAENYKIAKKIYTKILDLIFKKI